MFRAPFESLRPARVELLASVFLVVFGHFGVLYIFFFNFVVQFFLGFLIFPSSDFDFLLDVFSPWFVFPFSG